MYANCGALANAHTLVNGLAFRDTIIWTALISAYVRQGYAEYAFACLQQMRSEGVPPDTVTLASILKACSQVGAIERGKQIHDEIVEKGLLYDDIVLGTALVDMYCKCGAPRKAQKVFELLVNRDVICWNSLIGGLAQQNQGQAALRCFAAMKKEGLLPNAVTFTCILQACGSIGCLNRGEQIHYEALKEGLVGHHMPLDTALMDMYAKCGAVVKAHRIHQQLPVHDVASWSALIQAYAQHNQGELALICFECMQHEGFKPNASTLVSVLKACGSIGQLSKAEQIHDQIVMGGLLEDNLVLGNALLSTYVKCGAITEAEQVLDDFPSRNVVSWSTIIAGYVGQRQGHSALHCIKRMQLEGITPNAITFTSLLQACGLIGSIEKGEQLHNEIAKQGLLSSDAVLGCALVDMYAKCGAIEKASRVVEKLPSVSASVVPWSSLVAGYALRGQCMEALESFRGIQCKGLSPDGMMYSSVLNSCSLAGLVEKGQDIFTHLAEDFSPSPALEHYTCMMDMYRCAGHLDNAMLVARGMPFSGDHAVYYALLNSSCKWGDRNSAKWVVEQHS
ncbi:hypothetical protein KP509_37G060900 [Ceratopteris richardii]|nr:hypothetical protein KP509_37G060900 [Ceratopteris richardii]